MFKLLRCPFCVEEVENDLEIDIDVRQTHQRPRRSNLKSETKGLIMSTMLKSTGMAQITPVASMP